MRPVYAVSNPRAFRMGFPNLPGSPSFDFSPPDLTLRPGALEAADFSLPQGAAPDGGEAAAPQVPQGQVPMRPQYVLPTQEQAQETSDTPEEEPQEAPSGSGPGPWGWAAIGAVGIGLVVAALS